MIIYKTTNLVNGRFYVGKDKYNNPNYMGSGKLLKQSILKYGIENFKKEILEICNESNIDNREIHWINKSRNSDCYNIANGGEGGDTFTHNPNRELTRELHRRNIDNNNPMNDSITRTKHLRIVQSDDYKQNMSKLVKNRLSDPIARDKLSKSIKVAINTPDKLKIWSDCKKGSNNGRWLGRIEVIDLEGTSTVYESAVEVSNKLGVAPQRVREHCKNNTHYVRGPYKEWTFKFCEVT